MATSPETGYLDKEIIQVVTCPTVHCAMYAYKHTGVLEDFRSTKTVPACVDELLRILLRIGCSSLWY